MTQRWWDGASFTFLRHLFLLLPRLSRRAAGSASPQRLETPRHATFLPAAAHLTCMPATSLPSLPHLPRAPLIYHTSSLLCNRHRIYYHTAAARSTASRALATALLAYALLCRGTFCAAAGMHTYARSALPSTLATRAFAGASGSALRYAARV